MLSNACSHVNRLLKIYYDKEIDPKAKEYQEHGAYEISAEINRFQPEDKVKEYKTNRYIHNKGGFQRLYNKITGKAYIFFKREADQKEISDIKEKQP